jgi:hypothetical protein
VDILAVPVRLPVFPMKTLLTRPGLDQRGIDVEVLVEHQRGPLHHQPEKASRDLLIEQPLPILGKGRRVQAASSMVNAMNQRNSRM